MFFAESARRETSKAVLRTAAAAAVVLLSAEFGLRLAGYGNYILYERDPDLLWLPKANQQGVTVAGHKIITINSGGFRYKTQIPHNAGNKRRIFAFGDSVTMGWGMDDDSHYVAVLERLLNERDPEKPEYQVISAGVNGYPMSLVTERFSQVLQAGYELKAAIIAYSFNGTFERFVALRGHKREKLLKRVALKSFVRRFALYNFLVEDILRNLVYYRLRSRLVEGSWAATKEDADLATPQFSSSLRRIKELSDRYGVNVVLLLLGTADQKDGLGCRQKAFIGFAQREGIPLVNMVDWMKPWDHEGLFLDHVHPSKKGHELIARALLPAVENVGQPRSLQESNQQTMSRSWPK